MKPQRWQEIDRVFEAALELEKDEWAAFLDQKCAGDDELRREVESLLRAHEQAGSFIEKLPPEAAEEILKEKETQSLIGEQVGAYRIMSLLGAGGMGEVYLARDTRLDRRVAIKLLSVHFNQDKNRLRRFEQEARAASALSHPNICVIHEVGETRDGRHFITMEYVEGLTLHQYMAGKEMPLSEVLDVAVQVASALTAAHAAGIIHRDIKPENIMRRPDGYVKVLDFGLAKLSELRLSTTDTKAPTRALVKTAPGIVMGTCVYMSPEQARGVEVDARTDVWSLGIMLYEMIAGRIPFEGATQSDVISLILKKDPPPLGRYVKDAPAELERIVNKALVKNREERYQTIKDMWLDLKALKQEQEFAAKLERSVPPHADSMPASESEVAAGQSSLSASPALVSAAFPATRSTSSAEYLLSEIKRHKATAGVALAALIIVLAVAGYFYFPRASKGPIDSVAVLPFINTSDDPNTEYLSDGITESIIGSLSQLSQLRVMARSTVFRYKGKDVDPQKVGNELGVRAVLTGRVIQQGDNLTIRTELVNVSDGTELWGQQYNRKLSDALVIQEEIAKEISDNLRLKLSGAEQSRVSKHYTENPEAYQLYLKGRYYWNKRTPEATDKGIEYFQQAIERDPSYALAYAGLADCYVIPIHRLPPKEKMPKAKAAAMKALEIDDTLAEAHTSLGRALMTYDWDWPGAKKQFQRAIELNPRYSVAHQWYGGYWQALGRSDESVAEKKRAQELDPLSAPINFDLGITFYYSRQYDQAIAQYKKTLEMDPNIQTPHINLSAAYEQKGMYDESVAEFQKTIALTTGFNKAISMAGLGHVYAVSGRKADAQKVLNDLNRMSEREYVPAVNIALVYAGLGENDQAFTWLEKAYEERSFMMTWLKVEPRWDSLRSDPRFADLLRRVGLTPK